MKSINHFNKLFSILGERLYHENNISDIMWCIFKIVPSFKYDFLKFFDIELNDNKPLDIQREVSTDVGRPDFVFYVGRKIIFILEVKLNDRNYHFEQYKNAFVNDNPKIGILTNHFLDIDSYENGKKLGWHIRTWQSLVNFLLQRNYDSYQCVIDSFLCYLRKVCNIIEYIDMQFDPQILYSVFVLVEVCKKIIYKNKSSLYEVTLYSSQQRAFGEGYSGVIYELSVKQSDKKAWPFFGIVFEKAHISRISIALDEDWNSELVIKLRDYETTSFEVENYPGGGGVNLFMPQDKFNDLNGKPIDYQERCLAIFFNETNAILAKLLNK